jgi:hypothetical protein
MHADRALSRRSLAKAAPARSDPSRCGAPSGLLQRKCACGGAAGMDGKCAGCRAAKLRRSPGTGRPAIVPAIVLDVLRAPGEPLPPAIGGLMAARFAGVTGDAPPDGSAKVAVATAELTPNRPGDRFEQEAEHHAAQALGAPPKPASQDDVASFARAFAGVRVHHDARAGASARAIAARAYTVGPHIVFADDAYAPQTEAGRRLLAHELAHTLQQGPAAAGLVRGAWDKAESECGDAAASSQWIEKVVVDQEPPQEITAFWSDGNTQSDACSTGKGHCCVDAANPSGVACTVAGSHADGSNCTPITLHMGFPVRNRVLDHKGVAFWTEFVPERAIALHKYAPVDGTPLSHGCVRMNHAMAKTIFCNVRQNRTWVQVHGFARPDCDHDALRQEWLGDFAMGGADLAKADGDTAAQIRETRRELNAAFGRTLTVEEIRGLTADDIPRCSAMAPLPKPAAL